jgi:phosphodiesterase/alkaline phosphatase D-like protein
MPRLRLKLAIIAALGSSLSCGSTVAQILPPAPRAAHVAISQGPTLEMALDNFAIVRWTTNNPGGSNEHFGVVNYGTDPSALSQVARSPIRLNQGHPETMFRVRVGGLQPQTTYYYTVTSVGSDGTSDGVSSPVNQFTTPSPGQRVVKYPQP